MFGCTGESLRRRLLGAWSSSSLPETWRQTRQLLLMNPVSPRKSEEVVIEVWKRKVRLGWEGPCIMYTKRWSDRMLDTGERYGNKRSCG